MKLQPKILILVVGILIVSFGALSVPLFWYTRDALESELNRRLLNVAQTVRGQINRDLLRNLVREPALTGVRLALEQELAYFLKDGIEGIAVYSGAGAELARKSLVLTNQQQIAALLQTFTGYGNITHQAVSEIYRLPGGEYFKTAAIVIDVEDEPAPILAVWGGVEFMSEVDQLEGSLFWFVLIAIIVAVSPSEKLAVNGTITAKEVKVTSIGWPDHVFQAGYDLMPLPAVERYIAEHQHLPGVPSAEEVAADGQSLGETQALLLQKIEELTLYVIDVKNENEALKERFANFD